MKEHMEPIGLPIDVIVKLPRIITSVKRHIAASLLFSRHRMLLIDISLSFLSLPFVPYPFHSCPFHLSPGVFPIHDAWQIKFRPSCRRRLIVSKRSTVGDRIETVNMEKYSVFFANLWKESRLNKTPRKPNHHQIESMGVRGLADHGIIIGETGIILADPASHESEL